MEGPLEPRSARGAAISRERAVRPMRLATPSRSRAARSRPQVTAAACPASAGRGYSRMRTLPACTQGGVALARHRAQLEPLAPEFERRVHVADRDLDRGHPVAPFACRRRSGASGMRRSIGVTSSIQERQFARHRQRELPREPHAVGTLAPHAERSVHRHAAQLRGAHVALEPGVRKTQSATPYGPRNAGRKRRPSASTSRHVRRAREFLAQTGFAQREQLEVGAVPEHDERAFSVGVPSCATGGHRESGRGEIASRRRATAP